MINFIKGILIILLILPVPIEKAAATDNSLPVRVGISDSAFKTYLFDSVEFINAGRLNITDRATGYTVPVKDTSLEVKITNENNLLRIYLDGELVARNLEGPVSISDRYKDTIKIKNLKRKGKQAAYRGIIEITRSSKDISKFAVVNVLSLKNYLRGVVPNEMPKRFGLEALKAQTVAARNYAVTPRIKAYKEFDLCDSVACQVYFGADTEEEISNRAIDETNGIIALDKENKPILALYSSTAGGYTESYEYAFSDPETKKFPSKDIHYLTAVPDKEEFEPMETEEAAEKFYLSSPSAFDDASPYYRWSKEWSLDEINSVLKKTLPAQSKTGFISPQINSADEIGNLISVSALLRGKSGKIIKLQITTDKNVFIVQKELVIRRCFQKNGISLPSANFVISIDEDKIKFTGGGFGHGVGLSQWGAGKMASLGYSYQDILKHYYKGIKLATIPIVQTSSVSPNERTFYTESKKAKLILENPVNVKKVKVTVNDKELVVKTDSDLTSADISKYLEKGVNKISCLISEGAENTEKSIKIYIETMEAENE